MNGWSEPYRRGYEEGFAKGQNEIVNKSLLEIKREAIQTGREIAEEEHKAMCESCIHRVSAEDIEAIRADAINDIPKCKDCCHWKLLNLTQDHICDVFDWMSKEDDYCSFVEVKEQKNE